MRSLWSRLARPVRVWRARRRASAPFRTTHYLSDEFWRYLQLRLEAADDQLRPRPAEFEFAPLAKWAIPADHVGEVTMWTPKTRTWKRWLSDRSPWDVVYYEPTRHVTLWYSQVKDPQEGTWASLYRDFRADAIQLKTSSAGDHVIATEDLPQLRAALVKTLRERPEDLARVLNELGLEPLKAQPSLGESPWEFLIAAVTLKASSLLETDEDRDSEGIVDHVLDETEDYVADQAWLEVCDTQPQAQRRAEKLYGGGIGPIRQNRLRVGRGCGMEYLCRYAELEWVAEDDDQERDDQRRLRSAVTRKGFRGLLDYASLWAPRSANLQAVADYACSLLRPEQVAMLLPDEEPDCWELADRVYASLKASAELNESVHDVYRVVAGYEEHAGAVRLASLTLEEIKEGLHEASAKLD